MPAPRPSDPVDLSSGEFQLGPYRLLRPISGGGMARVYEGRLDSMAGVTKQVAVKVIHPDFANESSFQELFFTEARISALLEHTNLVRIQQLNQEGELYYMVMEFIDGITFRKIISACRRQRIQLPVEFIAELGRQVCEGLHYAHSLMDSAGAPLNLVHRDIKPSNLMLNTHGVAKVLDFGISSANGTPDTAGGVKGTWGYMSLEQANGRTVGSASDMFGLGAVLYELAAGEPVFADRDPAALRRCLMDDTAAQHAAELGGVYGELGAVLVRSLQRDPDARHRSAAAFGRALSSLVQDPVGVREGLIRLVQDVRAHDNGAAPMPPAASGDSVRSVSTLSRASLPARGSPRISQTLPVAVGDAHGLRASPRPAPAAPPPHGATFLAVGLLALALSVLGFAAWQLFFGAPPRPSSGAVVPRTEGVAAAPSSPVSVGTAPSAPPSPPVAPAPASAPSSSSGSAGPQAIAVTAAPSPVPAAVPGALRPVPAISDRDEPPVRIPLAVAPPESTAPAPAAVPVAPVVVPLVAPPAIGVVTVSERKEPGLLTISSMPRAQVMVDGHYVRYTPVYQHTVAAGSHAILLVTEDGRRKSFKVDVAPGTETRRIWLFEEERWSDQ